MWRRVAALSHLRPSFRSALSNQLQGASGLTQRRTYCSDILTPSSGLLELGREKLSRRAKTRFSVLGKSPFVVFVLGGHFSGKSTQCSKIAKTFGFAHVNAADVLKDLVLSNTQEGSKVRRSMIDGKFPLSEVVVNLIQKKMESIANYKFIIEEFPQNERNRVDFERTFGSEPNMVLYYDCTEEEMIQRVVKQHEDKKDTGRFNVKKGKYIKETDEIDPFDNEIEDMVARSLDVFEAHTVPVIEHYSNRGLLHKIDAVGTREDVFERVRPLFSEFEETLADANVSTSVPEEEAWKLTLSLGKS